MYVDRKLHTLAFLSAEQLDIPQPIYDALIEVRRRMLSGEIVDSEYVDRPDPHVFDSTMKDEKGARFFYGVWKHKHSCGTTACIGGWVDVITGIDHRYFLGQDSLYPLYYNGQPYTTIPQAIRAIENFLRGWEDPWLGV